jgi:GT2 family glycosyltransferase
VKLDVIIPFHGQFNLLLRCLRALSIAPKINGFLYLVDDDSPSQDLKAVRQIIDSLNLPIRWISLNNRSGFVKAINIAWLKCEGAVSVILNSDTIPSPELLPMLSQAIEQNNSVAAVGPTSDNQADLYQFRLKNDQYRSISVLPQKVMVSQIPYLTGMCLAVRRYAIEGLLFDPIYSPGYFEDLDLSCRLRTKGWKLAVLENCQIHHMGRGTFETYPTLDSLLLRNFCIFSNRWAHIPEHSDLNLRLHRLNRVQEFVR